MHILDLPIEIFYIIINYLDLQEISNFTCCSSDFSFLIHNNSYIQHYIKTLKNNLIVGHIAFDKKDILHEISFYFSDIETSKRLSFCLRLNCEYDLQQKGNVFDEDTFHCRVKNLLPYLRSLKPKQELLELIPTHMEYSNMFMEHDFPFISLYSNHKFTIIHDTYDFHGLTIYIPTKLFVRMMDVYLETLDYYYYSNDDDIQNKDSHNIVLYSNGNVKEVETFPDNFSELIDNRYTTKNISIQSVFHIKRELVQYCNRKAKHYYNSERFVYIKFYDNFTSSIASLTFELHDDTLYNYFPILCEALHHSSNHKTLDDVLKDILLPFHYGKIIEIDPYVNLSTRSNKDIVELSTFQDLRGISVYFPTHIFHQMCYMCYKKSKIHPDPVKYIYYSKGNMVCNPIKETKKEKVRKIFQHQSFKIYDWIYKKTGFLL